MLSTDPCPRGLEFANEVKPSTWSVSALRTTAEVATVASSWNALARGVPFRSYEWTEAWWKHYATAGMQWFVLAVHDEAGQLRGLAPWYRSRSATGGQVVRFLGDGEVCSDYASLLCRPADAQRVARSLAEWLAGPGQDQWHTLELTAVDYADEAVGYLRQWFVEREHPLSQCPDVRCWRAELAPDWPTYLKGFSKSRRERISYSLRRYVDSGLVQVRRATDGPSLERALAVLVELHQKRRAMLGQAGCFASAAFTAMQHQAAARLMSAGRLRLLWLELEGRPLAVEYAFTGDQTVFYYQGGFEPELAEVGPGTLMLAVSIKMAIAEGYRSFDFLRGDESYKAWWNAQPRPLVRLRIAGRRPSARVRHAAWRTGETMKHWARARWQFRAAPAGLKETT